jgi:predicted site-specific integrase-resolvase
MWIKSFKAKEILGISNQALYQRRKRKTIEFKQLEGCYFYWIDGHKEETNLENVIYCRVSNTKQKTDLKRQEILLKDYCVSNGYKIDYVFSDIASGMNENRKSFKKMLDLVFQRKVNKIFISYKDRLTRFGFQYFEEIFERFGTKIDNYE